MNAFEKFIYFLQGEMPEPHAFGWFHIMWLILALIVILLLNKAKKNYNDRQLKLVLGIYSIVALVLEILKQIMWSFNYDVVTNVVTWDYQWYAFPFQLCTTPIIICIFCLFLKKGKLRDALLSFLAFVTILGSISTMLLPDSCFVEDILVNIHTMWLHVGSFVVSVYLLMTREVKINLKSFRNALIIFLAFVFLAEILNIVIYNSLVLNGETFNMFYISPYFNSTLPIFNVIQPNVPYLLYLLIYILILSLGSFIIYLISLLISVIKKKMVK